MDAPPRPRCARCTGRRIIGAQGADAQREAIGAFEVVDEADCPVCEGCFVDEDAWLAAALEALAPYEFKDFQVGTQFPAALEQEEKAWKPDPEIGDSLRTEANRLLAPRIAEATGAAWEPGGRPDIVVHVDTRFQHAEARANSLFLASRYAKHRRDIPQTHWPCKRCQGLGCWECDDAGVQYEESVEDAIGEAAQPVFGAQGYSFHGAGREDIDALMLGTGRPFVLELHDPKKRNVDLAALEATINGATAASGVGVSGLRITEKEEVARIKGGEYEKEYLAHCIAEGAVTPDQVAAVAADMSGVTLQQRTPERVAHRRADLVRPRTVYKITVEEPVDAAGTRFGLRVHAESGTYIKEMVSGDGGRTEPSFAAGLGVPCVVEFLDVVGILDDGPNQPQA